MNIILPKPAPIILKRLYENGFEGYIVGGCVRDYLMGENPKDIDITTNAVPQDILRVFAGEKVIETGIKHGTVTVVLDSTPIEITTYRVESDYTDYRHPDHVQFCSSLKDDLCRRDFTMNALAYNEAEGIVDYCGGIEDINNKIIRAVGNPEERFNEDALRILRAARFASVLGFEIEHETAEAMKRSRGLLKNISVERLSAELIKLLCGKDVRRIMLSYTDILSEVIPELTDIEGFDQHNPYHIYDILTHTAVTVENMPDTGYLRLAALLHDIGKPKTYTMDEKGIGHFYGHSKTSVELAKKIMMHLKLDRFTQERVCTLVRLHDTPIQANKRSIKKWLFKITPEVFFDLLLLKRADILAKNPSYLFRLETIDEIKRLTEEILKEQECFSLKDLKISGDDLKEMGFEEGPLIGKTLDRLLKMVINDEIKNDFEKLKIQAIKINKK